MNEDYFRERARLVRDMADKADPFTKKRLLALAFAYDTESGLPTRRHLPSVAINGQDHPNRQNSGGDPS